MATSDNQCFVGNLTFNTTEEQLREIFSFVGPVKNVRILTDKETGKPKGFAFVEYFDSTSALSAIKNLDQTECNSRKLKVGFPAQGNLKEVARQIGQVVPETSSSSSGAGGGGGGGGGAISAASRLQIEQSVVNSLKLHEAWDLLDAMKKLVAEDNNRGNKAKGILETHPQLISALYEIQKRLGIALPKHIQQQQSSVTSTSVPVSSELPSVPPVNSYSVAGADARTNNNINNNDYRRDREYREWDNMPREGNNRDWERPEWENKDPRDVRQPSFNNNGAGMGSVGNIRTSGRTAGQAAPSYHDHPYGGNNNSNVGGHSHSLSMNTGSSSFVPPPQMPHFRPPLDLEASAAAAPVQERKSRFN